MCSAFDQLAAVYALSATTAVFFGLWLVNRHHLRRQMRLTIAVVGRACQTLHTHGVSRTKTVDLIAPELTGQAAKIYKRDATYEFVITAFQDPSKKKTLKRQVLTQMNDKGMEVKNRFEGVLDPVEEPNLRKILAKIDAARRACA